jgi:hypothetical protein
MQITAERIARHNYRIRDRLLSKLPGDIMLEPETASPRKHSDALELAEFNILRAEIEQRSSEGRAMERNVMIISSVIYGFLLTPKGISSIPDPKIDNYHDLAWYLPPLLNFLALVRWRESVLLIMALSDYIKGIERASMKRNGWEVFLARRRNNPKKNPALSIWYIGFWCACIGGTAVVAFFHQDLFGVDKTLLNLSIGAVICTVVYWVLLPIKKESLKSEPGLGKTGGGLSPSDIESPLYN